MNKFSVVVLLALCLFTVAAAVQAEVVAEALSVIDTSQPKTFAKFATSVMVCNLSTTDQFWIRVFTTSDTVGAAVAALPSIPIPVASATQPSCFSVPHNSKSQNLGFKAMTYIAASGKTPTGYVVYE